MILPGGPFSGYIAVQVPESASKIYTDDAVRQMFASAVIRKEVPVEEQLAQMPFKIRELSDFRNVRTLAVGAAIVLADGDEEKGFEPAPFMVIGIVGATPTQPEDRGRFAQQVATTIPGVRDVRITMSEPLRIDGLPGYETRIDAVSGKDNTPVTVVQWLRFGSQRSLRIIGSAPREEWTRHFHASAPYATAFSRAEAATGRKSCAARCCEIVGSARTLYAPGEVICWRRPVFLEGDAACWTEGTFLQAWARRRSRPLLPTGFGRRRSSPMRLRRCW